MFSIQLPSKSLLHSLTRAKIWKKLYWEILKEWKPDSTHVDHSRLKPLYLLIYTMIVDLWIHRHYMMLKQA